MLRTNCSTVFTVLSFVCASLSFVIASRSLFLLTSLFHSLSQAIQYPTDFPAWGFFVHFRNGATVTNKVHTFYARIFRCGKSRIAHVFISRVRKALPPLRHLVFNNMHFVHMLSSTEVDCGKHKGIIIICALGLAHERIDVGIGVAP